VEIVFTVCWEIVAVKKKKKGQVSIAWL
jgi:hypothetical protein